MPNGYLRRPLAGALAAVSAIALHVAAPATVVGAAGPLVAKQGERVFVDNLGSEDLTACTIGYNEVEQRRSYTAGHCAVHGDTPSDDGAVVYLADERGRQLPTPAGMIYPAAYYYGPTNANDWAVIYWFNNVEVGRNRFGGDYVPIDEVRVGETLCYHGYASHAGEDDASCGPYVGMIERTIYFDAPGMPDHGDSGGPVYVPGKGVVGVMSGANALVDGSGNEIVGFERASSLVSGPIYGDTRIDAFLRSRYDWTGAKEPTSGTSAPRPDSVLTTVVTPTAAVAPARATATETPETTQPSKGFAGLTVPAAPAEPVEPAEPTEPIGKDGTYTVTGETKTTRVVVAPPAPRQPSFPTGAATPSSVPSEPPEAPEEVPEARERRTADALLIAFGVVASLAVLVSAVGYVLGAGK